MSAARRELAEAFLREAVYRSRGRQAASVSIALPRPGGGQCGLGEKAAVVLDLTPRAEELSRVLWPTGLAEKDVARVQVTLADWVVEQDALDRQRNHFLKAFRQEHGFDRDAYTPAQSADFEAGLARINSGEDERRRAAAATLIGL